LSHFDKSGNECEAEGDVATTNKGSPSETSSEQSSFDQMAKKSGSVVRFGN
jgi:hypothetical protein